MTQGRTTLFIHDKGQAQARSVSPPPRQDAKPTPDRKGTPTPRQEDVKALMVKQGTTLVTALAHSVARGAPPTTATPIFWSTYSSSRSEFLSQITSKQHPRSSGYCATQSVALQLSCPTPYRLHHGKPQLSSCTLFPRALMPSPQHIFSNMSDQRGWVFPPSCELLLQNYVNILRMCGKHKLFIPTKA